MRRTLLALPFLLASCGKQAGFVIDNVSISPGDIPVGSQSTELLKIGADVLDDTHVVTDVWVVAEGAALQLDMSEGDNDDHWTASIPIDQLTLPVGTYPIDVHALDDAGHSLVLQNAVQLKVTIH